VENLAAMDHSSQLKLYLDLFFVFVCSRAEQAKQWGNAEHYYSQ